MSAALQAAQAYVARGWNPLPLPFKSKIPTDKGWQNRVIGAADLPKYFNGKPQNVGVVLGPSSNDLTDVDLDAREAIAIAPYLLPKTGAIFGRRSAPASHWLYHTKLSTLGKAEIQFLDPKRPKDNVMLLEVRIGGVKGAQTVFPGSVHESDEEIRWDDAGDPAKVLDDDLLKRARLLAVASLLARYWPGAGVRHKTGLILGGFLARAGLDQSQIKCMVEGAARAASDKEWKDRVKAAEDAALAFHAGDTAAGFPLLSKAFGEPVAKQIAEWLQYRGSTSGVAAGAVNPAGLGASPVWRECRKDGFPVASLHNARAAITAIGVACSYDTFHDKMLFGYKDDTTRHVVEQFLGEVSDNGILSLRRLLSDCFGFDLTEKHVRDAVVSLALEHCFDPVADLLAEAEANWDGVPRLDRMAADYFNCEDTPLNAACVRKTMIAAVARVRQPGIKFDTILVLESPEGKNKSTALRVLAGDENFSDEKIIGKDSREVQEQLAAVWIHENADLAGMKKAEVETVKAYASRQVDRARPAYGRFLKQQPRHSIEVGTTNGDEYLQSQTGNRRFWPMTVLKAIDLEKLGKDRLQLWGEAAHYQSKSEALTIDEGMWPDAGVEQEKRRVKDPWEAVLAKMPEVVEKKRWDQQDECHVVTNTYRIIHPVDDQERVASEAILAHVLEVPIAHQTTAHTMRLANAMKMLGWQRTSNGKVTIGRRQERGYFRWTT
jgi:predicted P-loop ATPase